MSACPLCDSLARPGPRLITRLTHTSVFLGENQGLRGWCVLVLNDHAEHVHELGPARASAVFGEVARVGAALWNALQPRRINYECLGNVVPHVHWHVIPRAHDDPSPAVPVWGWPAERLRGDISDDERRGLIESIRAGIG